MITLPASLILGESYDFPGASAVTLNDMVKTVGVKSQLT